MTILNRLFLCTVLLLSVGFSQGAEKKPKKKKKTWKKKIFLTLKQVQAGMKNPIGKKSGQGDFIFEYDSEKSKMFNVSKNPQENLDLLRTLHGGFAIDRRKGKGGIYSYVYNIGIIRVSSDLTSMKILNDSDEIKRNNLHNATIFYNKKDEGFLSFPGNNNATVYITDLEGKILHRLKEPKHNDYYKKGQKFGPTDTEVVGKRLYITTGYSKGDYVITADPFKGKWTRDYFAGKGKGDGLLRTSHGITHHPKSNSLHVADRSNFRTQVFSTKGKYLEKVDFDPGVKPCDIDFHPEDASLALVGCLTGELFIVKDKKILSKIEPFKELKIPQSENIHNAMFKVIDGKTYIIAQSWNPGSFVVLKQL